MIRTTIILIVAMMVGCSPQVTYVSQVNPDYYRIDKRQDTDDEEITALIQPYKTELDQSMNRIIGTVEKDMSKNKPNSPLNNWVADVLLDEANARVGNVDFAVQNYGGIRVPNLAQGEITIGKIYELMPFDNLITVLTADGKIVQMLLDRIADYGGWPISRNTSFTIRDGKAVDIIINGKPFDPQSTYTFALPDYVANGGDNSFFLSGAKRNDLKLLIRDAMIHHVETHENKIKYIDEKRILVQ